MQLCERYFTPVIALRTFFLCLLTLLFQATLQPIGASSLTMVEIGHEEACGCGMKCRKDLCCCKPESVEKGIARGIETEQENLGKEGAGIKPACLMSSPCGEVPDAPESPRNRAYSPKLIALISFAQPLPEIQFSYWTDFNHFYLFNSVSGLERPPRA